MTIWIWVMLIGLIVQLSGIWIVEDRHKQLGIAMNFGGCATVLIAAFMNLT